MKFSEIYIIEIDHTSGGLYAYVELKEYKVISQSISANVYDAGNTVIHYSYIKDGTTCNISINTNEKLNSCGFADKEDAIRALLRYHVVGGFVVLNEDIIKEYPEYCI